MREIALIGKKIGMSREFYKTGQLVPVTVIKMEKARVIQVIDTEKRGYKAVQLGFGKIAFEPRFCVFLSYYVCMYFEFSMIRINLPF